MACFSKNLTLFPFLFKVSQPQTQYRVIGGGGEVQQQQPQQQQQIRVVKMDGGSAAIAQTQQAQPQQIRVLNSDGTTSALGGNFRIISASGQQGRSTNCCCNLPF